MKVIIWKKRREDLEFKIITFGFGKGTRCMGNTPKKHWITFSLIRKLGHFKKDYCKWSFALMWLQIKYSS